MKKNSNPPYRTFECEPIKAVNPKKKDEPRAKKTVIPSEKAKGGR